MKVKLFAVQYHHQLSLWIPKDILASAKASEDAEALAS
jgi:hypothetical protein